MRPLGAIAISSLVLLLPVTTGASPASRCRKACKPLVSECRLTTGQSKRACKRLYIPACKRDGLSACTATTTTTPTPAPGATTSTTVPGSGSGGGVMYMRIEQVDEQPADDRTRYTFTISIEYGIVTADAVKQIPLDPASFTVRDDDTDAVYPAEPAGGAGDCTAAIVLAQDDPPVTCTLHFLLPPALGAPSPVDGGVHSYLEFTASGLHASRDF